MARRGGLLGKLSDRFTDPRKAGGSIDPTTRLIDPTRAILLEAVGVAEIGLERDDGVGEIGLAVEVRGRLNTTEERARILLLLSPDSAALLIAQITGLMRASRNGPEFSYALAARMKEATGGET